MYVTIAFGSSSFPTAVGDIMHIWYVHMIYTLPPRVVYTDSIYCGLVNLPIPYRFASLTMRVSSIYL